MSPARLVGVFAALLTFALAAPPLAMAGEDARRTFIDSATVHGDGTVSLPLYWGMSGGERVWFVVLDASDSGLASDLGVNRAAKLENARGSAAVQPVQEGDEGIEFPATVDFAPERRVVAGPTGFPPAAAEPGAVGEPGYSPLVELPDGTILNAPHVANASGVGDRVVSIDTETSRVRLLLSDGLANGKAVEYLATDASDSAAAALERGTFAPALGAAPGVGDDSTGSSRAQLVAFVNGATGAGNPERQGLNSALLDGLDPLNVLAWTPNQGRYSPLWDVHPGEWRTVPTRQEDVTDVLGLVAHGDVSGPGGAPFGPAGFVVNCPIVSEIG